MTDLAIEVRRRAKGRCEYCRMPESGFRRPFHIEHIVAKQHGGPFVLDNLALACWTCNLKKGPNLAGVDPESGELTPLFHPRKHVWTEHFGISREISEAAGVEIRGLTPIGRTTVSVLGMNQHQRRMLRFELWREEMLS